jgi:hypothetical protein
VDLYIHSLVHLHGILLHLLSTRTNLTFIFYIWDFFKIKYFIIGATLVKISINILWLNYIFRVLRMICRHFALLKYGQLCDKSPEYLNSGIIIIIRDSEGLTLLT